MGCDECGGYPAYRGFCGDWLCARCGDAEDAAVERAQERSIQRAEAALNRRLDGDDD